MNTLQHTASELDLLQARISEVVQRLRTLEEENRSLRSRQEALVAERAGLVQRNEEARTRVEAMIERLKSLETAG
ncbi:MAG: TIGR02449 family protein [Wenzhouxiangella sp.]|nr:MAG: TIGR02449 family protein [Wenzhouxiangella sp.]